MIKKHSSFIMHTLSREPNIYTSFKSISYSTIILKLKKKSNNFKDLFLDLQNSFLQVKLTAGRCEWRHDENFLTGETGFRLALSLLLK